MSKKNSPKTFLAQAKSWATRNKLFGKQAFLRHVIFQFVEQLNAISDDFIFKGGNLLWVYLHTPRTTIDLDLSTLRTNTHESVHLPRQLKDLFYDINKWLEDRL